MALTKLNDDLNIISALDDLPNDVGGLTAAELKAKFDKAGNTIKLYLNNTLVAELDTKFTDLVAKDAELQAAIDELVGFTLPDNAVTTAKIANQAVTHAKLDLNAVENSNIKTGAVNGDSIAPNSVSAGKLTADSVITAKIKDGNVTHAKLNSDAVWDGNIKAKEVKRRAIADSAIGNLQIDASAVSSRNLQTDAVTTDKIQNGNVTANKLAADVNSKFAPAYTFGVDDRVDGSASEDPEGTIYWVVDSLE